MDAWMWVGLFNDSCAVDSSCCPGETMRVASVLLFWCWGGCVLVAVVIKAKAISTTVVWANLLRLYTRRSFLVDACAVLPMWNDRRVLNLRRLCTRRSFFGSTHALSYVKRLSCAEFSDTAKWMEWMARFPGQIGPYRRKEWWIQSGNTIHVRFEIHQRGLGTDHEYNGL